jgi:hypothetical protein
VSFIGAGQCRRWRSTIAVLVGLGLFVAVVGSVALQSELAAAAMPQVPSASQQTPDDGVTAAQMRFDSGSRSASHFDHGSYPMDQKPFNTPRIKRDRPLTWARGALVTLAALGFQPRDADIGAPTAAPPTEDILTRLCVARL